MQQQTDKGLLKILQICDMFFVIEVEIHQTQLDWLKLQKLWL